MRTRQRRFYIRLGCHPQCLGGCRIRRTSALLERPAGSGRAAVRPDGLDAPQVEFALHSRKADFWELMSFASGDSEEAASGEEPAAAEGPFGLGVVRHGVRHKSHGGFDDYKPACGMKGIANSGGAA